MSESSEDGGRENGGSEDGGRDKPAGQDHSVPQDSAATDPRPVEPPKPDKDKKEDDEPAELPFYKRPLVLIIGGIVLAAIIIGGILYWLHARQYESTDDAFVDAHIIRLAPQISGTLSYVRSADNRHVNAGDILAVIEPDATQAQKQEALAGVAQAQVQIAQAEADKQSQIAAREQAAASSLAPAAQATKAAADLARYEALARINPAAVAGTQLDAAREAARSADAQALAAKRQIRIAQANVEGADAKIEAARAALETAKTKVRQSDVTVGYLTLRAPVSGQVVQRNVNLGSYVAPGAQILALVPDEIWITANFKETQLALVRPGQPVAIHVDSFPDVPFVGHVDSIQRGAGQAFALLPPQNATGNYVKVVQRVPVRILFDIGDDGHGHQRPDPRRWPIGPGMSVVPTVKVR